MYWKTSLSQLLNFSQRLEFSYSETLNKEYIERIHQMSYSSLSDNGMLQIFSFFNQMIIRSSLKLFPHIYGYLFIFANTEIYGKLYKIHWKSVKMTFDKFFRCVAQLGFSCNSLFIFKQYIYLAKRKKIIIINIPFHCRRA